MPQTPIGYNSVNPAGALAPTQLDAQGAERVSTAPGKVAFNMTAPTIVKAGPGRIGRVNVIVAGTAAGGVYDCATTAQATALTQIASIPTLSTAQLGSLTLDCNVITGLVILPGTGQTLTAIYE